MVLGKILQKNFHWSQIQNATFRCFARTRCPRQFSPALQRDLTISPTSTTFLLFCLIIFKAKCKLPNLYFYFLENVSKIVYNFLLLNVLWSNLSFYISFYTFIALYLLISILTSDNRKLKKFQANVLFSL